MMFKTYIVPLSMALALVSAPSAEAKKHGKNKHNNHGQMSQSKGKQHGKGQSKGNHYAKGQNYGHNPVITHRAPPAVGRTRIVRRTRVQPAPTRRVRRTTVVTHVPRTAPRHHRNYRVGAPRHQHVVRVLPNGSRLFMVRGLPYYRHGDVYYRRVARGEFVVVAPPLGAIVRWLPPHTRVVRIGARRYMLADGVYYRRVAGGYMVVQPRHGRIVRR